MLLHNFLENGLLRWGPKASKCSKLLLVGLSVKVRIVEGSNAGWVALVLIPVLITLNFSLLLTPLASNEPSTLNFLWPNVIKLLEMCDNTNNNSSWRGEKNHGL